MGLAIGSAAGSPSSPSLNQLDKRDPLRNNSSSPSVNQSGGSSNALSHHHHQSVSSSSRSQTEDPQTAAQRQAAAKLALRKQLEKTLLQVNLYCP